MHHPLIQERFASVARLEQRRNARREQKEFEALKAANPQYYQARQEKRFAELLVRARSTLASILSDDAHMCICIARAINRDAPTVAQAFTSFPFFKTERPDKSIAGLSIDSAISSRPVMPDDLLKGLTVVSGVYIGSKFAPQLITDTEAIARELEFLIDEDYMIDALYDAFGEPEE